MVAGIAAVIVATFFHMQLAAFLGLSARAETRLIYWGLFWGGVGCGFGIIVSVAGLVRTEIQDDRPPLLRAVAILVALLALLVFLFYRSISSPSPEPLRPGETILI